jgi:hypothetical protein
MELNCHVSLSHITYFLFRHSEDRHVYRPVTRVEIYCSEIQKFLLIQDIIKSAIYPVNNVKLNTCD